jgi:NTE family protein
MGGINMQKKVNKIGLVLGSGGAKGLSHIGVLKLLEELNIKIDFIAGSSIGALIGGAYASGLCAQEIEEIALKTDLASTAKLFLPGIHKSGLISGTYIRELLYSFIGDKKIEDMPIPFTAVTTDIITGQEVYIRQGDLLDAIRASISIPIIFKPVIWNDTVLVDGGLVNPVPINVVRKMGADYIIAVNVMSSNIQSKEKTSEKSMKKVNLNKPLEVVPILQRKLDEMKIEHNWLSNFIKHKERKNLPWITKIFNQTLKISQEKLAEQSIDLTKPDILIEPAVGDINIFDFHKAKEIIEIGYQYASETIEKKLIGGI